MKITQTKTAASDPQIGSCLLYSSTCPMHRFRFIALFEVCLFNGKKQEKTTLKQSNTKNCKMSLKCYVKHRKFGKSADICRQMLSIAGKCRRNPIRIQSEFKSKSKSESESTFLCPQFFGCKNQKIQVCSPTEKRKLLCLRI